MPNSILFTEAHKMTKLTIQTDETYRYKFGQWLIFLKTGITNKLGITNINQSVCYVPVLSHDKIAKATAENPITYNSNILKTLAVTAMVQAQMAVVKILTWSK